MRTIWLLVIMLAVVACGEGTPPEGANPDQPVGTHATGPVTAGSPAPSGSVPSPTPATPKGNTVDPHKVRWTNAEPLADGRSLRVVWWSGVEPCHTLDRVEVSEDENDVTVTLYEGPDRASPDVMCIEIAVEKFTDVRLSAPLAGRRVIDGAK